VASSPATSSGRVASHVDFVIHIPAEDSEIEELLAFMRSRFGNEFVSEQISITERAIKLLRIADNWREISITLIDQSNSQ
jgi:hypothetical protein